MYDVAVRLAAIDTADAEDDVEERHTEYETAESTAFQETVTPIVLVPSAAVTPVGAFGTV